jgi:transposase InsO family protein
VQHDNRPNLPSHQIPVSSSYVEQAASCEFPLAQPYRKEAEPQVVYREPSRAKKTPVYNGKTSWLDYLVQFDLVAEVNRWSDTEKALELATSLRDTAQGVLAELDINQRRNYQALVAALTNRFEPPNFSEVYRAELKCRTRNQGEKLCDLVHDIKQLVRKAYSSDPTATRDKIARDVFIDSLNDPEMEWSVHQQKPVTVDQALKCAIEYESFQVGRRRRTTERRGLRMHSGLIPIGSSEESCSRQLYMASEQQNDSYSPDSEPPAQVQYECNGQSSGPHENSVEYQGPFTQPQHVNMTSGAPQSTGRQQSKQPSSNVNECWFCHTKGHIRRDCRKYHAWLQVHPNAEKHVPVTVPPAATANPAGTRVGAECKEPLTANRRILGMLPHNDGLFLTAKVASVDINFLIDTGGTLSVLHVDKYESMPDAIRPPLQEVEGNIVMGNGSAVKALGIANFLLEFGNLLLSFPMVVAKLEVPGVIGYDFLYSHGGLVDVPQGQVTLKGQILQCKLESRLPSLFRISLEENVSVPPRTEILTTGIVEPMKDTAHCTSAILEPSPKLLEKTGLFIARCLVNPSSGKAPLRIINVSNDTQVLYAKTTTATGEPTSAVVLHNPEASGAHQLPEFLDDLYTRASHDLDDEQKLKVRELLIKHSGAFAQNKVDIGRTDIVKHQINTGAAAPIKQPLRRQPLVKRQAIHDEIEKMKQQDLIEPSSSPWASPVVLVKKRDGSWRFCIDYRKLNDVTIKDSYPIPRIDDSLDALSGNSGRRWFSTMDLASGYWQVAMDPKSAEHTAFVSAEGLFQFKVMPFGLTNAPATFERLMETILAGLHWTTCLIYLDDIIVFADSFEQQMQRLDEVITKLREAGLKLSPKKCNFFKSTVKFLGHIVSSDGVSADPEKIKVAANWPTPANIHEVRSFLGTCSYYRRFIDHFADIAKPLHKLTLKQASFVWTDECDTAFKQLKHAITNAPVLSYPSDCGTYILDTDASLNALGAVLHQVQDGEEKVIAYYSQAFSKEERNYCTTRRELLAIVKSVKHFHHYLYGQHFIVRTDHGSLTWLLNFKNPEGQLARWLEIRGTYHMDIKFRAGKFHSNADGLSRIPCDHCTYCSRQEDKHLGFMRIINTEQAPQQTNQSANRTPDVTTFDVPDAHVAYGLSHQIVRDHQLLDVAIGPILKALETGKPRLAEDDIQGEGPILRNYWRQWDRLTVRNGVLYRKWYKNDHCITLQLVVPSKLKANVLEGLHDDKVAGHMGIKRTTKRVQERYYWPGYNQDVAEWCKKCTVCQARAPGKAAKASLKKLQTGARLQRSSLDILGPLPRTESGNRYILLITDYFSKWVEAVALSDIEAATVARAFIDHFVTRFGVPAQIHTDQGKQFEAKLFQEMCAILGADKTRTTPYWPQSDGFVERMNRTLEDLLSKMVQKNQRDWDMCLQIAMLAYRSSVQESTGYSPAQMMYGMEVNLPVHLSLGPLPAEEDNIHQFVWKLREHMKAVHDVARENLKIAAQTQKRQYDQRVRIHVYKPGDKVWLTQTRRFKGISPKLQSKWIGPYTVVKKISDVVYKVKKSTGKSIVVHHNRLKPYLQREKDVNTNAPPIRTATPAPVDTLTSDASDDSELTESEVDDEPPSPPKTRYGRRVVPPRRFTDNV